MRQLNIEDNTAVAIHPGATSRHPSHAIMGRVEIALCSRSSTTVALLCGVASGEYRERRGASSKADGDSEAGIALAGWACGDILGRGAFGDELLAQHEARKLSSHALPYFLLVDVVHGAEGAAVGESLVIATLVVGCH